MKPKNISKYNQILDDLNIDIKSYCTLAQIGKKYNKFDDYFIRRLYETLKEFIDESTKIMKDDLC